MRSMMKKISWVPYFTLCAFWMLMRPAHAYLDPAATSYIIQIVAGVFITCGVVLGIFWKKIRLFFRKLKLNALQRKLSKTAEKKAKAAK